MNQPSHHIGIYPCVLARRKYNLHTENSACGLITQTYINGIYCHVKAAL